MHRRLLASWHTHAAREVYTESKLMGWGLGAGVVVRWAKIKAAATVRMASSC